MATDVEESDTEDHERPAPPKRQCMKIINSHDDSHKEAHHQATKEDAPLENESEYERTERLTREKLRRWQACQVAKGFVDNTINRVMENYILGPQADPSQFRLFRGTEMEDTAVMMAIKNHGLVHSGQLGDRGDIGQSYSSDIERSSFVETRSFSIPTATTSAKIPSSIDNFEDSIKDKEDFLERAVAEAIKIKGLSALSVDYG